ncbi:hypothetical protein ACPBEI_00405 [Latilactobacillus sakei]
MNTKSLNSLQAEVFNTLQALKDAYVITNNINVIDKKGLRSTFETLTSNYPEYFTSSKKIPGKSNSYIFDGNEKEVINFLSLTSSVELISPVAHITSKLTNNKYLKLAVSSSSDKLKTFIAFIQWLDTSLKLKYITQNEYFSNKGIFLKMMKISETELDPTFMEDSISGYKNIFIETEDYLPTLFKAVFNRLETEAEIDCVLRTFFHINYELLKSTAQFLSDKTGQDSFKIDFWNYSEDISHNDNVNYNSPSPELYQYVIDSLERTKHNISQ